VWKVPDLKELARSPTRSRGFCRVNKDRESIASDKLYYVNLENEAKVGQTKDLRVLVDRERISEVDGCAPDNITVRARGGSIRSPHMRL